MSIHVAETESTLLLLLLYIKLNHKLDADNWGCDIISFIGDDDKNV